MDKISRIHMHYAQIVIEDKCAFVPNAYFRGAYEVLRDLHKNPSGGNIVCDDLTHAPVGQYIYIE